MLHARIKEFGSEKFLSLDRSLNHMHSKPKLEAVFIFPLLKKIKSKERNGFLWRECIRPACYMPCQHTYTALQRQSVKIFPVEICCSLPVCRLCCVVLCNSLQFTECDKNFGSHFLLIYATQSKIRKKRRGKKLPGLFKQKFLVQQTHVR